MPLSEFAARAAKPRAKPYKVADGEGLFLLVQPGGGKLWRLKYRFAGKEKLLALGAYPEVGIAAARERRAEARELLASGMDPSVQRKLDRIAAQAANANTFAVLAEEYLARLEAQGAAEATLSKNRWLLIDVARPLAARPVGELTAAEILHLLQGVERSGRRETARRLRSAIGAVFRYAIATLRAQTDPTYPLRGALLAPKVTHRAAITDLEGLGGLLRAIDEYDGWPTIKAALRIGALTFARPGEVRGATRGEFDLERAVWTIPAGRTKMRREHVVPLSRQAVAVLRDIWPLSEHGAFVFASIRSSRQPLSENTLNAALRRIGYSKDEMTAHGFRASASTILNERGYDADVIEAALGHQDGNAVRRAYNRATYWTERVAMMQAWADLLDAARDGQSSRPKSRPG